MDDPAINADVRVNVGVIDKVESGHVRHGIRVEDALAQFGFTNVRPLQIRGWTRDGKSVFDVSKDDFIAEDMTLLLLRPIAGKQGMAEQLERSVRELLPDPGVATVLTEPDVDSDGQSALRITVVLEAGVADRISGTTLVDVLMRLNDDVQKAGEDWFPYVSYKTREEVESSGNS